jgi:protoheme ferro-lyase
MESIFLLKNHHKKKSRRLETWQMMEIIPWLIMALASLLAGICLVLFLVAFPLRMNFYLLIFLILVGGAGFFGMYFITADQVMPVLAICLACFIAGYLGGTGVFLSQHEKRDLPAITRQPGKKGRGHTAVIYFTHGEPPGYDPFPWLETMREFDHDKVPFIPFPFRPFFFHAMRKEYLKAGGSPHNRIHEYMFRAVQAFFPAGKKKGLHFYLAFLDCNPRPDEMAIRAINDGADRIILLPIFITISSHTQAGQGMVAALEPEKFGVSVCMAEPLWDSEPLKNHFVQRAEAARGDTPREQAGILLIGHGQPKAWDAIYPTQTEQENQYREGIKDLLVQKGYRPENVLPTWMSFKKPSIAESLRTLVTAGVAKILVFSASISAAAIHSEVDVLEAIHSARLDKNMEVVNLGAFGDPFEPLVVEAFCEKIQACL